MSLPIGRPLSQSGERVDLSGPAAQLFQSNRDLLLDRFPDRCGRLLQVDFQSSRFTTVPSQNGAPTLIGFRRGGQLICLDDPADPEGMQQKWFDHFSFTEISHAILLGFGAGHIRDRLGGDLPRLQRLAVMEPHADLLAVACATYDLSAAVANPKVSFAAPEDGHQAALWIEEWLAEDFDPKRGDQVGFLLSPFFLRSAPEFLVDFMTWLQIKDDKFQAVRAVLEAKFPTSPGFREDWEWGLSLVGVRSLRNLSEGLLGAAVVGPDLDPLEEAFLKDGDPEARLVLSTGALGGDLAKLADGLVLSAEHTSRIDLQPHQQIFADIDLASRNPLPGNTVIFRTEVPPKRDQILARLTTPGLLKNKGTLVKQIHPAGLPIDLGRLLGCREILLLGVHPTLEKRDGPDLEAIGLREQMRQSGCRFHTLSKRTAEWLPEVRLASSLEDLPSSASRKKMTLPEAVDVVRKKPPSLPAPRFPIDRSLAVSREQVATQAGMLKKPSEGNLLEILFQENLKALRRLQPAVAAMVEARIANPSPEEAYQLGLGPEGFPHLAIVRENERIAVSPLSGNPWKDVVESESWNCLFSECANLVVGLGLGFHIEAILERTSGRLMVWEPVIDRFMAAMHVRNLEPLLASDRIDWSVGKTPLEAAGQFVDMRTQQMYYHPVNWEPFIEPGVRRAYASFAREFLNHFRPRIYEIRSMRNEAVSSAKKWAIHFLRNTPRKAEAASLKLLRGRFKGVPAVIVSAGPSLDETAHLLNEVRDRALIFVVDTSFRVVSDRGIDRHFVVSVDQKDATLLHFADRTPRETDILIATSGAPPLVWDLFPGPRFFGEFETGSGEKSKILSWIAESLGFDEEYLFRGNSVAISSIGAAHLLGCEPIILLGQDLAILPDRTHAEGTIYPIRQGLSESAGILTVPAVGGGTVPTTQWLKNIQNNLEYTLMKHRLNVINATARGARIRGTTEIPFSEVLEKHLGDAVPVFDIVSEIFSSRKRPTIDRMRGEVDSMTAELEKVQSRAREQLKELPKLLRRIERGDYPADPAKRFTALQTALIDIGLESLPFQRFQDFVYREANAFSEQHVRVQNAPDPVTKVRWQVERMIPLLEALGPGLDEARAELAALKTELARRFDG